MFYAGLFGLASNNILFFFTPVPRPTPRIGFKRFKRGPNLKKRWKKCSTIFYGEGFHVVVFLQKKWEQNVAKTKCGTSSAKGKTKVKTESNISFDYPYWRGYFETHHMELIWAEVGWELKKNDRDMIKTAEKELTGRCECQVLSGKIKTYVHLWDLEGFHLRW